MKCSSTELVDSNLRVGYQSQMADTNRYTKIIERIFLSKYRKGTSSIPFNRDDLSVVAVELGVSLPKNLGDIIYSFRYRNPLPISITKTAPRHLEWIIRPAGRSRYCFEAVRIVKIEPSKVLAETKVPDSTPGIISMYSLSDEQALLAKLRYNRLVDIFTGVTCFSLQNHLRTTAPGIGQIETDEVYVGVDKRGAQYVFPVQAKGGRDKLNVVQIEQDLVMCKAKFPSLICRPIAAQFKKANSIALFELTIETDGLKVSSEKHYRLVPPEDVTDKDLKTYRNGPF